MMPKPMSQWRRSFALRLASGSCLACTILILFANLRCSPMHTRLAPATRPTQPSAVTDEARSIEVLRNVMVHEERFAKVHDVLTDMESAARRDLGVSDD